MPTFDVAKLRLNSKDREELDGTLIYLAKIAEKSERFEDMVQIMTELLKNNFDRPPTSEEQQLVATAFKNVVGSLRAAWRTLEPEGKYKDVDEQYKSYIEAELTTFCNNAIALFDNVVTKSCARDKISKVFYLKLVADHYRYLAEIGDAGKSYSKKAADRYTEALALAEETMKPTNPIRLGVALNYSVCLHEVMNDTKQACQLAKGSFNQAIAKLDNLDEAWYKDSTLLMQLLRDNLTAWTVAVNDK